MAKRILLTGAGGSAALGFIRSLRKSPENYYIIGGDANPYYLERSEVDEKYLTPKTSNNLYRDVMVEIIDETKPDFVHSQVDAEIMELSKMRDIFDNAGVKYLLPNHNIIEICQSKFESYECWENAGLTVPETIFIRDENDLKKAFEELGSPLWIREDKGAFGKGALPANNFEEARIWINVRQGWGKFTSAEMLDPTAMVTWQSIWYKGTLVIAQTRKRLYWEFSDRSPSGVTGLTGAGVTISDKVVDEIANEAILAIDKIPHGIYSVDMTYDKRGVPNPTEINIGRFFTTHQFFTEAGLNMPYIFLKIGLDGEVSVFKEKINPLPQNLVWIRGLDFLPKLSTLENVHTHEINLQERIKRLSLKI